jgi:hypothetical protein
MLKEETGRSRDGRQAGGGAVSPHRPLRLDNRKIAFSIAAPILFLAAGCGGMNPAGNTSAGGIVVHAAKVVIDTNTSDQLTATSSSGAPVAANWSIAEGQNDGSLGQGTISTSGLYTPPPLLSRDTVNVEIKASFANDPATAAIYSLTVTPSFVQSLTPETASLAPGGTLQVTGELAEVNSGSIHWSLATNATGGRAAGAEYGSLRQTGCRHSSQSYTYCTATYTAPSLPPGRNASLYVVGSAASNAQSTTSLHILLNSAGFNSSALDNQAVEAGTVEMGSSGGNANDYDSSQDAQGNRYVDDCCGGTLGALVEDKNDNLYILSNNHVLAESDQARLGDTIVQPALIDANCNPQVGRTVGSLRYVVPIESTQTNVDAALAATTAAVDTGGGILKLGSPVNGLLSTAAPAAGSGETLNANRLNGLEVVKSGRTTGLTCSTVNTIDLRVQVDYYYDCAEKRPYYTKTYTNQIGIPGASFADSGDSGALLLDASNAQPVGLFFASGAGEQNDGFSIANPIQDVLSELGEKSQAEGQQFQIVGGEPHPITCSNYDQNAAPAALPHLSAAQLSAARSAADNAASLLVRPDSGVLGLNAGRSLDAPEQAAVIVYTDKSKPSIAVPKVIDGFRTLVIPSDAASVSAETAPDGRAKAEGIHLSAETLRAASAVERQYAPLVMNDPAFFGVGVTESYDNPAEAALLVLVDLTKTPESMPALVGGMRVRYLRINRLHVTRAKSAGAPRPTSCELHTMLR